MKIGILRELQDTINACEPCLEKIEMQARLDLMVQRLKEWPSRVADRGPFATATEAEAVMREELEYAFAAWEPMH